MFLADGLRKIGSKHLHERRSCTLARPAPNVAISRWYGAATAFAATRAAPREGKTYNFQAFYRVMAMEQIDDDIQKRCLEGSQALE